VSALDYDDALARALAATRPEPSLRVPVADADGHILAEPIIATIPLPRWRSTSMDGVAIRAADLTEDDDATLRLAGTAAAGDPAPPPLAPGTAWRVATGGRIPANADSVIRQEDLVVEGDRVRLTDRRDVGRNIRAEGADVAAGALALTVGRAIGPGTIALLAALGVDHPLVIRRPRVAILASGNELADRHHTDRVRSGESIADVNTPMLTAMVRRAGGTPIALPLARDSIDALGAALTDVDADFWLTAGGVSVGPHDHVPEAIHRAGATVIFRRARIRPGGPVTLARLPDGRLWLALPGNPVSAWVTFLLFARPILHAMAGVADPRPAWEPVHLADAVARHPTLDLFPRMRLDAGVPPVATTAGPQASWYTSTLADSEALIRIPSGTSEVPAGTAVMGFRA
jgi:molybdopterin molybdotransferase